MPAPLRDRGIVLRSIRLGDSSKITSALTEQHGRVKLVAKGARRLGSRLGALLEPGNELELLYYPRPGRDLWTLGDASLQRAALTGGRTLDKLSHLLAALELADRLLPEQEPVPGCWTLWSRAVDRWHASGDGLMAPLFFALEIALAEELGVGLGIVDCGACGRSLADAGRASYIATEGQLLCPTCARGQGRRVGEPALAALPALGRALDGSGGGLPPLDAAGRRELGRLLHEHLAYHLPQYRLPRSLYWLQSVAGREGSGGAPAGGSSGG